MPGPTATGGPPRRGVNVNLDGFDPSVLLLVVPLIVI